MSNKSPKDTLYNIINQKADNKIFIKGYMNIEINYSILILRLKTISKYKN